MLAAVKKVVLSCAVKLNRHAKNAKALVRLARAPAVASPKLPLSSTYCRPHNALDLQWPARLESPRSGLSSDTAFGRYRSVVEKSNLHSFRAFCGSTHLRVS